MYLLPTFLQVQCLNRQQMYTCWWVPNPQGSYIPTQDNQTCLCANMRAMQKRSRTPIDPSLLSTLSASHLQQPGYKHASVTHAY
jgi:hypothetical protein